MRLKSTPYFLSSYSHSLETRSREKTFYGHVDQKEVSRPSSIQVGHDRWNAAIEMADEVSLSGVLAKLCRFLPDR